MPNAIQRVTRIQNEVQQAVLYHPRIQQKRAVGHIVLNHQADLTIERRFRQRLKVQQEIADLKAREFRGALTCHVGQLIKQRPTASCSRQSRVHKLAGGPIKVHLFKLALRAENDGQQV